MRWMTRGRGRGRGRGSTRERVDGRAGGREARDPKTRGRTTDLDARRDVFPRFTVRSLREELHQLQEPGSYVGEVVKVMGKKVLVKVLTCERERERGRLTRFSRVQVHPEGKYVCDMDKSIDVTKLTPGTRVALRNDCTRFTLILPSNIDPPCR